MQILVDQGAGLGRGGAHDALDHVGRQLLHHVHRVVDVHLLDDAGQLRVCDGVDDALLFGRLQMGKNLRRRLLGEKAEDHGHAVVFDGREEFRHVEIVQFLHAQLELLHLPALQQLAQLVGPPLLQRVIVRLPQLDLLFFVQAKRLLPSVLPRCGRGDSAAHFIMSAKRLQGAAAPAAPQNSHFSSSPACDRV